MENDVGAAVAGGESSEDLGQWPPGPWKREQVGRRKSNHRRGALIGLVGPTAAM